MLRIRALVAWLSLLCLTHSSFANPSEQAWPDGLRQALTKAENVTLFSLHPSHRVAPGEGFHGWRVLGQTQLNLESAQQLTRALSEGIDQRSDPERAECFAPRHGLSLDHFDLVICFECQRLQVYQGQRLTAELLMTRSADPVFREAVENNGLAWAGWTKSQDGVWRACGIAVPAPVGFSESFFAESLRFSKTVPRLAPLQVQPLGTALLIAPDGKREAIQVGNQELSGWPAIVDPLTTYVPDLEATLDLPSRTLTCQGSVEALNRAKEMLEALSQPVSPQTTIALTRLHSANSVSGLMARYRREWEKEYAVDLRPTVIESLAGQEVWTGIAGLHGVPTLFSIALVSDGQSFPLLVRVRQPQTDTSGDALSRTLQSLRIGG